MTKIDMKKDHKALYRAKAECSLVDVPDIAYLMIDGTGDPNTNPYYGEAVSALYTVAYGVKFIAKAAGSDHVVMPLEGLWWTDDMAEFTQEDKSNWKWTMLIAQPDNITLDQVAEARDHAVGKKHLAAAATVRFERWEEGRAAQILHLGAYADEAPTITKLHEYIADSGLSLTGKHHEIYLSDPSRAAPEKLKTIVRQPIR
jgi:hypothetical protein